VTPAALHAFHGIRGPQGTCARPVLTRIPLRQQLIDPPARSRQISAPAEVRKKLGLAPGSVLEWEEQGDTVVVRRAGRYSSAELHSALFPGKKPAQRSLSELKDAVRSSMRKRYARR
jgi:AbrB family looped-hinge helix DNA binding protein